MGQRPCLDYPFVACVTLVIISPHKSASVYECFSSGRVTPIPLKWTAKLLGSLLGGTFTALPRIPLANLDIPEPKARQHAGKRLACIFVGDLQDAVLQCGCLKLAFSFLAYLAFKIRIGRGEQSGVA